MKTILLLVLAAAALGVARAPAQNVFITGGSGYQACSPAVLRAPVICPSQVIYQAPVVCQPSVVYVAAAPAYCAPSPNVIYFGGPRSDYQDFQSYGCSRSYDGRSPVIYFGRGQGYTQGYRFRHRR